MPGVINHRELQSMHRGLGSRRMVEQVSECLRRAREGESGGLRPDEFSLREMAEALVPNGREWLQSIDPRTEGSAVLEAGGAVDTTAFSNITGQIVYSRVLEAYQNEVFVLSGLVPTQSTRFNGEKIPGVARIGDKAEVVGEGMPYPTFGFGEEYVETPATTKHGLIVPVTRESVFFDRTNLVLRRASEVGEFLGLNKEKRLVDVVIGATNNYKRNGTATNTFLTSGLWINDQSNPLVDWTDIEKAELLLRSITDPNTGEPILVIPNAVLVSSAKMHTARRIINSTEVRVGDGATNSTQTLSANPVAGSYQINTSQLVKSRLVSELSLSAANADEYWWLGDFSKAFAYMENWPITVTQAPQNSEAEFTSDIVMRFKASERGAAAIMDPRYVVRNKN